MAEDFEVSSMDDAHASTLRRALLERLSDIRDWGKSRYRFYTSIRNDPRITDDARGILMGVDCERYLRSYYYWVHETLLYANYDKFDFPVLNQILQAFLPVYQPIQGWNRDEVIRITGQALDRANLAERETDTRLTTLITEFYHHAVERRAVAHSPAALGEHLQRVESLYKLAQREIAIMQQ